MPASIDRVIGTDSHPSVPFNPQTNGIVERNIAEVMRHLRFIVNERRIKTDWSLYLPMVLRILNSEKINIEELSESDSESTCSRCSLRGKCSAQDGVCDGQTAEEVD